MENGKSIRFGQSWLRLNQLRLLGLSEAIDRSNDSDVSRSIRFGCCRMHAEFVHFVIHSVFGFSASSFIGSVFR